MKIYTVDERSRITLGSKIASPGDRFRIVRSPNGIITMHPVHEDAEAHTPAK